jgi:hypothetical protein
MATSLHGFITFACCGLSLVGISHADHAIEESTNRCDDGTYGAGAARACRLSSRAGNAGTSRAWTGTALVTPNLSEHSVHGVAQYEFP